MNTAYGEFLASKKEVHGSHGFVARRCELSASLKPHQVDIVRWALAKGRAAIFADCGLGKTFMQLEWARHVAQRTGLPVLVVAPLAVVEQTKREADRWGIDAAVSRDGEFVGGVVITNYQSLHKFNGSDFGGVVLDESSIIKSFNGKIRNQMIEMFGRTPYRLACTATPSPNDHTELGNHAEFLGVVSRVEMLATYFMHDGGETQKWRLKGHAESVFWQWVASWAAMVRTPSDVGHSDEGFSLPEMRISEHYIESGMVKAGMLFADEAAGILEQKAARKATMERRCREVADMVNASAESWIVWCEMNAEGAMLESMIPGSVQVAGADSDEDKTARLSGFSSGQHRVLISKPKIAGFGMNWQHCANMAFVGLTHSYEQFYQSTRRCWRFGQDRTVNVHIVATDVDAAVLRNIKRKEDDMKAMQQGMVEYMGKMDADAAAATAAESDAYAGGTVNEGRKWRAINGDCVDAVAGMSDGSIHYTIFSPPFSSLYTYSNSVRDMGNCKGDSEFMAHFRFLAADLLRVTMDGRLCSFHCMQLPTSKEKDGFIGIKDFRGDLIRIFQDAGWIFHSEVCIWKDPVQAMQRTKALGLLHKTIRTDSSMSRQGVADYLVTMRKPGKNPEPIAHTHDEFPVSLWQRYASPVWMDINPSDTLQRESARESRDERHIAPLQLEVIRRALALWSSPGDLVLSPFMGIGSEGYCAVGAGRRFVGVELKSSYYKQACLNLASAETSSSQRSLFDE